MKPLPNRQWLPQHWAPIYFLIATLAGLCFLFIALFVPPNVWIETGNTGSGTYYITMVLSLFFTPIPLLVNIIIGILPIAFFPLVERNSTLDRVIGALLFATLFALSFFIETIQISILSDAVWLAYRDPLYLSPWLYDPLSIIFMAASVITGLSLGSMILSVLLGFFGEYFWTSLRGPLYIARTRRTPIYIKGGDRGTVLSVEHTSPLAVNRKGGYLRSMVKPSKWQAYEREE